MSGISQPKEERDRSWQMHTWPAEKRLWGLVTGSSPPLEETFPWRGGGNPLIGVGSKREWEGRIL